MSDAAGLHLRSSPVQPVTCHSLLLLSANARSPVSRVMLSGSCISWLLWRTRALRALGDSMSRDGRGGCVMGLDA